jgi:hypothetical protein
MERPEDKLGFDYFNDLAAFIFAAVGAGAMSANLFMTVGAFR